MNFELAGRLVIVESARDFTSFVRDLREFRESKRIKREGARLRVNGAGSATFRPNGELGFRRFRQQLRDITSWARQSEQIDRLERELMSRHFVMLPVPRSVEQRENGSLSLHWPGLTILAHTDQIAFLIGGASGHAGKGIKPQLLEALRMNASIY